MKIYTKRGDDGTTFNGDGRVPKYDCSVDGQGELDELTAWIGMIRDKILDGKDLQKIQKDLMEIGAQLATNEQRIKEEDIALLESAIDYMNSQLPELKNFILPKNTPEIHVARTVCRRTERVVSGWRNNGPPYNLPKFNLVIPYLNRLSDYLFVLSRYLGENELIWDTNLGEKSDENLSKRDG
tara:strand:+ start:1901 stop:2449 length:549 start_codon:yes stop_codon:yes gene_type:complete